MIQKRRNKFVCVCDICGNELEPEATFAEAKDVMKIANWRSKQTEDGSWQHWCDECIYQDKLEHPENYQKPKKFIKRGFKNYDKTV